MTPPTPPELTPPKPLTLTVDILAACGADRTAAAKYVAQMNELLPYYRINTLLRVANFLGQILHESNRLKAVEEYASGEAYEGRKDLGNTQPGDGKRFKGRGLVQLTGRANYTAFARKFGIDCINKPELLTQPRWALATALWYWDTRNLNLIADKDDLKRITRIINGGYNGLSDRTALTARCKAALQAVFV